MLDLDMAAKAGEVPLPDGGWSCGMTVVENGIVFPPEQSAMVQPCGVVDASGDYVWHGATWRKARPMMVPPTAPVVATAKLTGRHLFAGQNWAHFGHFMAEGMSRLWALDHLKEQPESIIFVPKRPGQSQDLKSYQQEFFDLLGIDIPIRVIEEPTQVEELIVPGQGFGIGLIAEGTPHFRDFFANRFALDVKPDGPEGLYLSRTALGGLEGTVLAEQALEDNLAKNGIETFHPQQFSIAEQVARYRASTRVVSLDGSALHLFGFVGKPHQKVAMILRRSSNVFAPIRRQIRAFCRIEPVVIEVVAANWIPEHKIKPGRYSFGELDYEALAKMLHMTGFGPAPAEWDIPRFREMKQEMKRISRKKKITYNRFKVGKRRFLSGAAEYSV